MAQLEILEKIQCLRHGDVAVALEHHGGERQTRLHITEGEFSDDVCANLQIGNRLDHADGNQEDNGE